MSSTARKYGNRIIQTEDGTFDSAGEYARWRELQVEERAGRISDLRRQVPYLLVPTLRRPGERTEPALRYVADFVYREGDETIVEDFKGFETEAWRLKRRLFLWLYGGRGVTLRISKGRR